MSLMGLVVLILGGWGAVGAYGAEGQVAEVSAGELAAFSVSARYVLIGACRKSQPGFGTFEAEFRAAARMLTDTGRSVKVGILTDAVGEGIGAGPYPEVQFLIDGEAVNFQGNISAAAISSWVKSTKALKIPEITSKAEFKSVEKSSLAVLLILKKKEPLVQARFRAMAATYPDIPFYTSRSEYVRGSTNFLQEYNLAVMRERDPSQRKILSQSSPPSRKEMEEFFWLFRIPTVLEWNKETEQKVMQEKKNALILFLDATKLPESAKFFSQMAEAHKSEFIFCWVSTRSADGRQLAHKLGRGRHLEAVLITFQQTDLLKFVLEGVTEESLKEFLEDYREGLLIPFYKSEPVPKRSPGPVEVIVGKTFTRQVFRRPQKWALVLIYQATQAPSHEEQMLEQLATDLLQKREDIFCGKIDVSKNEHHQLFVSGVPAFRIYLPDSDQAPFENPTLKSLEALTAWVNSFLHPPAPQSSDPHSPDSDI